MKFYSDMLPMNLQMFAEDTGAQGGGDPASTQNGGSDDGSGHQTNQTDDGQSTTTKSDKPNGKEGNGKNTIQMTQADLDKLLAEREDRARREARKQSTSEAEKYKGMTDMQKMQKQLSDLTDTVQKQNKELQESKSQQEHVKMEKEVDKNLRAKGIVLDPDEVDFYVGKTAEETNAKVEKAIKMFTRLNADKAKSGLEDDKSNTTIDNGKASNATKLNLGNADLERKEKLAKTFGIKK